MPAGVRIKVRVTPNARRNEVVGWRDDCLAIKLTAPPVEGKANSELVRFLAEVLEVPARAIEIVSGETSRSKSLSVVGITPQQARERIARRVGAC